MKRIIFGLSILAILFSVYSCNSQDTNKLKETNIVNDTISSNIIQVYYFHGSIRCHTCDSVDENTHQYLKEFFLDKIEKGEIIYKSINIDENEREDLINKYEIYGQTLLFIKGEKVINETENAFQYVTTDAEKWKKIVEDRIFDLIN
jgi:hypothetical protein